jgi:ACR3 family arsenite efflux pump ArsB
LFLTLTYILSKKTSRLLELNYEDCVLMMMTTAALHTSLVLAATMVFIPDQPVAATIIGMLIELPHLIVLKIILKRQYKIRK